MLSKRIIASSSSSSGGGGVIMRSLRSLSSITFTFPSTTTPSTSSATTTSTSPTTTSKQTTPMVMAMEMSMANTTTNKMIHHNTRRTMVYAAVNHSEEYKEAMEGRHGQQLSLAHKEAEKYKQEVFNPFEEYKIDEAEEIDDEEDNDEFEEVDEDDDDDDDHNDDDNDEEEGPEYNVDGSVIRTRAELASLKAGAPGGGSFAIVNLNGTQEKVTVDDVIITNKLKPVDKWAVGSTHTLTAENGQLLLLGSQEQTLVGLPYVNGGEVDVMVEEITRDKKVIVFKKKRRKNYRRKNGHRREVTFLRVLDIRFPSSDS